MSDYTYIEEVSEFLRDNMWAFEDRSMDVDDLLEPFIDGVLVSIGTHDNENRWYNKSDFEETGENMCGRIERCISESMY